MHRPVILSPILAALLLADSAAAAGRPNVVVVLIDDLGYGDFSCYGNERVETTNIDRLAAEGVRFTQYYAGAPICSPSRVAITTGQSPARWGVTSFLAERRLNERRGMEQWLDPSAPTLARMLSDAGYATGHFGKWHMGGQRDVGEAPLITEYGFDESLTQFEGLGDRVLATFETLYQDDGGKRGLELGSEKLGRGNVTWKKR
ncbi:MAG TPA: sulfatase-like hydrolase/transferase, partial [Planctomycetaceae bacterium]